MESSKIGASLYRSAMAAGSQVGAGENKGSGFPASVDCKAVFDKIDQWQKDLIDLTRRNRQLYLTEKKAERQVEITSPGPQELIDALIGRGATLDFPMPIYNQLTLPDSTLEGSEVQEAPMRTGDLQTNLPVIELQRRLGRLRRDQRTSQEEQGIHTLFLAIAFLRWDEKPTSDGQSQEYLAPIILVPVELDRKSADDPYFMKLSEEEVVVNPALLFKLRSEFRIELPELPEELDGGSVTDYLGKVEEAAKGLGWQVMPSVRLGKFTYEKFVMYNDLGDQRQAGCNQPIIRALAKAASLPPDDDIQVPHNLDEVVNPRELFPLLDADSSQMEVLLRFRRGQNLVIVGPPGTGKSQTIANLIAQGLRDGKKILFVSEKMAALEVVNRRLQSAGLSFACLEVHSHHSDKLKVVQELAKTLNQVFADKTELDAAEQYQKLIKLRDQLNNYVTELHKVRGNLKLSAFQVHGKLSKILDAPKVEFQLPVASVLRMTPELLDDVRGTLHRVESIDGVFDNLDNHPWHGVELRTTDESGQLLDPSMYVDDLETALNSLRSELGGMQTESSSLATSIGVSQPTSIEVTQGYLRALGLLSRPPVLAESWTKLTSGELARLVSDAKELKELHLRLARDKVKLAEGFKLGLLALPIGEMLNRFEGEYRTSLRSLKGDYRREMRTIREYSVSNQKVEYTDAKRVLSNAKNVLDIQKKVESGYAESKEALAGFYLGAETNWDAVFGGLEWLSQLMTELRLSSLPDQLRELILKPDQISRIGAGYQTRLEPMISTVRGRINKLEWAMRSYTIEGVTLTAAQISQLESWLDVKTNPEDLRNWLSYQKARESCQKLGLTPFLTAAKERQVPAEILEDVFMRRLWKAWLADAYRESPSLADFEATSQERTIQEFQSIDKGLREVTVRLVRQNIAKSQPKAEAAAPGESQMGIILREARKKRRVMPLRKLFAGAPHLIQDLKPCMLMSPLSVASYLGTSPYHFDWVIFDEASQIPPADAVGSILRGTHLIVAGDDKQLPPTTFFQAEADYDDEDDQSPEEPLESVLDECLTVPGFRKVFLKWHYRSKREELIDFSNRNFYDGQLVTFPSPDSRDAPPAIEFRYVSDGIYDRGGSRTNVQEARAVCDLIESHFREYGASLSLGVITLGIQQEDAIWDEFDRRKIANPSLAAQSESNEVEPFFIKALEKVQGDERDCIIISLGYGKDVNGVLSMNFGPINRAGGERRLNVAVTRARQKEILVSSILPQDMDLTRLSTRSRGVSMLAAYLGYAQQGGRPPAQAYGTGEPESDFEYDVREQLVAKGFDVDAQVGCSGFRIDLAIRNPLHKDRYVLGIECDGATYHSQRSARDRDRLRQAVLEGLGWKIYRVWSTDWIRDSASIVDRIADKVKDLQERGLSDAGVLGLTPESVQEDVPPKSTESDLTEAGNQTPPAAFSGDSPQYGFKPYVEYQERGKRLDNPGYIVLAVVERETPIHIDALIRRVGEMYRLGKVSPKNRKIIMSYVRQAVARQKFQIRNDFCWMGGGSSPRVPPPGTSPRPVQEIALEELMEGARTIVEKERGIPRQSLVREVARVFGYRRTGEKVEHRIQMAIDRLYKEGAFSTYGNQVILASKDS